MRKFALLVGFVALLGVTCVGLGNAHLYGQKPSVPGKTVKKQGTIRKRGSSRTPVPSAGSAQGEFLPKSFPQVTPDLIKPAGSPPATFTVTVDPTLNLDPATLAVYQQMASQLSAYTTVPNDRVNYYAAFNGSQDYTIDGWVGLVESVDPTDGGYLVSLLVVPSFTTATVVENDYTEQFFVGNDGILRYLGFSDPMGLAGQTPPGIFDY